MYSHLKGKKLLVIGSDASNLRILEAAREMGVYTIVMDGITDYSRAPAKKAADESWDIDYSDVEAVASKCIDTGVNGVFAGYSEFRVLAACRIANRLGLPFYANEEQINLTRNKRSFKDVCQQYGVNVPRDYCFGYPMSDEDKAKIEYPVIVKPADYAGRKGISVCLSGDQLDKAMEFAVGKSQSRTIVIEDYLDGVEFSSVYTIKNGEISLSSVNEKYITEDQKIKTGLCECLITPASFIDRYIAETDPHVRAFLKGIKADNAVAFFQGMVTEKKIYIFEMGYRINGNNDFKVIEKFNNISFMKMLIAYSLCGDMCDDLAKDNPRYAQYVCTFLMHAHAGTIAEFDYSAIFSKPQITEVTPWASVGKTIDEDGSVEQKVLSMRITADTVKEIAELIDFVQQNVTMKDTEGRNMLFAKFDTGKLMK